jgi:prepilin-type N-terminal cleavage/methylation domain-containing protein
MGRIDRRNAFTLIEVLIVVIIMAVLAATIIPQFSSSTNDAKGSAVSFNLHTIRTQIELYKAQHLGTGPAVDKFKSQMTGLTNTSGVVGTDKKDYPFGPYIQGDIPVNPFKNSNAIKETNATTQALAQAAVGGAEGWMYNPLTGDFYPNNVEYYTPTP